MVKYKRNESAINDQETLDLLQSVWMTYGDKTAKEDCAKRIK